MRGASSLSGNARIGQLVGSLPTNGLTAWWEFINSAGGTGHTGQTISDSSGNGNTLTIVGPQNPSWPIPSTTGLQFGANYFSPAVTAPMVIAGSVPKTIITVFNSSLNGQQGYMVDVASDFPTGSFSAHGVFLEGKQSGDVYGHFSVVPDVICAAGPRAAIVPDNQWTFGAVRYAGSGEAYLQNVNLEALVTGYIAGNCGTPTTLTFSPNVAIGSGNTGFTGTIAEVVIYSRSLSDVEMEGVYAYFKTRLVSVGITLP